MDSYDLYKIKLYIYGDRPRKLKNYIKKHRLDPTNAQLKKNRNLLHYCCKHGSTECLRYLLSSGVDGLAVDVGLNTPLHLALNYALYLDDVGLDIKCGECYSSMILPLIEKFPACLEMVNKEGETCRYLLQELVKRRKASAAESSQESYDYEDADAAWRNKLAEELQDEYDEQFGRYAQDYDSYAADEQEVYEDWADQIRAEYYARKRAQEQAYYNTHQSSRKRKHADSQPDENEDLKNAREKMRKQFEENRQKEKETNMLKKRMKYEDRYKKLMDDKSLKSLSYNEIPWPSRKGGDSDITVLFEGFDKSSTEYKKYLRDQKIRWHPDKFMQRFGRYLVEKEKDKIIQRVTSLSQGINQLVT